MEMQSLEVTLRDKVGKGPARRSRALGMLPAVLYGGGKVANVTVNPRAVTALLLQEGGQNKVLTLKGTGVEGRAAMIREYQIDPLSRKLVHIDLLEIDLTKTIQITVKLAFTGKALGVADGGVVNIIVRAIPIRCLPNQIPTHIDVDVTALKIGDSIHLADLTLPAGLERIANFNPTLVTVVPPAKDEELAPSLAPSAEPEVITEKKAAEGEEGAAAAGGKDEKGGAGAGKPAAGKPAASKKEEKKK